MVLLLDFFKLKACTWSYFSQVVRDKKGTAWRKVCTHSLQFCAVPKRGNCCWGCENDAKVMQDSDALFVYFLYLSAFLPTLCHLTIFCPEFVHHRIFGSAHHRICAKSESLHDAFVNLCIRLISNDASCEFVHHYITGQLNLALFLHTAQFRKESFVIVRFDPFTKYFSSSFALHELVISLAYLMRLLYALWMNFPLKY